MNNNIIAAIVFREVKGEYGVTAAQIYSKTRMAKIREARQVFTQLMREHSSMTLEDIGMMVNRDHSTISTTSKVIQNQIEPTLDSASGIIASSLTSISNRKCLRISQSI